MLNIINSADPEDSFVEPIFYREVEHKIFFETIDFNDPIKFTQWFKWVLLIFSLIWTGFVLSKFPDDLVGRVLVIIFSIIGLSMGLLGFFVIVPLFQKLMTKFGSNFSSGNNYFPIFDLKEKILTDTKGQRVEFTSISRLLIVDKKPGWFSLKAKTNDGKTHFLLNFKKDLESQIMEIGAKIKAPIEKL